jgi:hypothetical protein
MVMWRQHADIHHSPSDKPGLPTRLAKSDWLVAKPPAEEGAGPSEVVSTALPNPFGELPPSASPKIASAALRDSEAQIREAPAAQSSVMLERPASEEDRSAAPSEPSTTVPSEVAQPRSPARNEFATATRKVGTTGIKKTAHLVCWLKHGYYRKCTWYRHHHRYRYYE